MDKTIVILTGAGISAESGIPTFRASDGLWCNHPIEDVATPQGYRRNPKLVHEFYNARRAQLKEVIPNAAHHAIAELAANWDGKLFLITQNVDDLHDRATQATTPKPAFRLIHMHGELRKARCEKSGSIFDWQENIDGDSHCDCCNAPGNLRPHIVWFNEMPLEMDVIDEAASSCDLFMSIGTSGNVYPAAGLVHTARTYGRAHTVELNLEPSAGESLFHEKIYGPATKTVPEYVRRILAGGVV